MNHSLEPDEGEPPPARAVLVLVAIRVGMIAVALLAAYCFTR